MTTITQEHAERAAWFAERKCGARKCPVLVKDEAGNQTAVERFRPCVGGVVIDWDSDGYTDREEALAEARRYKTACVKIRDDWDWGPGENELGREALRSWSNGVMSIHAIANHADAEPERVVDALEQAAQAAIAGARAQLKAAQEAPR